MLRGEGEHTMLTLEIHDYDQLDDVVERRIRRQRALIIVMGPL